MSWSWLGPTSITKNAMEADGGSVKNVALVIGVTGIVGYNLAEILPLSTTPGGLWKVYGVGRRPRPWGPNHPVEYVQCDISDPKDTFAKLSPLDDVTHIFYVTWSNHIVEVENCKVNAAMLQNVIRTVIDSAPNLRHICMQTGCKHYIGGFDMLLVNQPHDTPHHEELPRLNAPNFYYSMEDTLFDEIEARKKEGRVLTWSIHRPTVIFGFSPYGGGMNFIRSLCVYAAVCKHEGKPLKFPGIRAVWDCYYIGSDADLIAEQEIWASLDPNAKNQAYNCNNGDLFKWKYLWGVIAQEFGMEAVGPTAESGSEIEKLEDMMKEKEGVWEEMVKEYGLLPSKLEEVGRWWFADIGIEFVPLLDIANKCKENGFFGFRNTMKSVVPLINKMRAHKVIP